MILSPNETLEMLGTKELFSLLNDHDNSEEELKDHGEETCGAMDRF